ncbi:MAG: F0F1 ATP synthase subunit A [Deltaproteobacteria bacterium]|nr:F0F1 ATP synthase subunit A [Deltaproteobacteria bacterium]
MPHGESWLSLLPGFRDMEHWIDGFGPSWGFGGHVVVQHVASIILVALFLLILSLRASGQLKAAGSDILPESRFSARTLVELVMEGVLGIMEFAMPRRAALKHFWLIGTLGFFILFSNLLGLLPGFLPPTENYNTTFACAIIVFLYYNFYAFYRLGFGHIAHMANPSGEKSGWFLSPLFIIIEPISHCIRPASLSIRLLCNVAGDHLVLGVFVGMFPLLLPIPFIGLGLFVALVQTLVFLLLSSVYIGEVETMIEHHEHAHGHGHEGAAAHH